MPLRLTTALFDGAMKAGAAADRLAAMGVDHGAVRLIPQDGTSAASVWDALAGLRLPDADRYGYAEAIRRGGVLLAVTAAEGADGQVVRALEEAGAVNLEEREDEWRACGWRGYQPASRAREAANAILREPHPAFGCQRLPGDARVRSYRPVGTS